MIMIGLSDMFYLFLLSFGAHHMSANIYGLRFRVLQYVIDLLMRECGSDRNLNPSSRVVAYGMNMDQIYLNVRVGLTLMNLLVVADTY